MSEIRVPEDYRELYGFITSDYFTKQSIGHADLEIAPIKELIESYARVEAERDEARKQSDKWMIDFGMECKKTAALEEQTKVLREALQDVINGNDLAHSRQQTMQSWPDSAFRKRAIEALNSGERPK